MCAVLLLMGPCAARGEDAVPPDGFLEFLGAMVESEGMLIDPLVLATPAEQVLLEEVERDRRAAEASAGYRNGSEIEREGGGQEHD
jgi:hypothetical protein